MVKALDGCFDPQLGQVMNKLIDKAVKTKDKPFGMMMISLILII